MYVFGVEVFSQPKLMLEVAFTQLAFIRINYEQQYEYFHETDIGLVEMGIVVTLNGWAVGTPCEKGGINDGNFRSYEYAVSIWCIPCDNIDNRCGNNRRYSYHKSKK